MGNENQPQRRQVYTAAKPPVKVANPTNVQSVTNVAPAASTALPATISPATNISHVNGQVHVDNPVWSSKILQSTAETSAGMAANSSTIAATAVNTLTPSPSSVLAKSTDASKSSTIRNESVKPPFAIPGKRSISMPPLLRFAPLPPPASNLTPGSFSRPTIVPARRPPPPIQETSATPTTPSSNPQLTASSASASASVSPAAASSAPLSQPAHASEAVFNRATPAISANPGPVLPQTLKVPQSLPARMVSEPPRFIVAQDRRRRDQSHKRSNSLVFSKTMRGVLNNNTVSNYYGVQSPHPLAVPAKSFINRRVNVDNQNPSYNLANMQFASKRASSLDSGIRTLNRQYASSNPSSPSHMKIGLQPHSRIVQPPRARALF